MNQLKKQIKDVHEFLADKATVQMQGDVKSYVTLLIQLASSQNGFQLTHSFSQKQLFSRIHMLTQPISTPMQKLRFLSIVPMYLY